LIRNFLLQIGVLSAPQKDWKVKPNLKVTNLTFFYLWELQRVTKFKKFKAHHDRIPAFKATCQYCPGARGPRRLENEHGFEGAVKSPWNFIIIIIIIIIIINYNLDTSR